MAKEKGGNAALIFCLVCFLGLNPGPMMAYGGQGNESKEVTGGTSTTWCIAKPSTSQVELDQLVTYCCNSPGVDCSLIQQGGTCYPLSRNSDASVVMNIYYNINGKTPNTCYFNGRGLTVNVDPSVGNCIYRADQDPRM